MGKVDRFDFEVTLADHLFFDPNFSVSYDAYIPLKYSFLRLLDEQHLTDGAKLTGMKLLIRCHEVREKSLRSSSEVFAKQGRSLREVLHELQENQLLTELLFKERIKKKEKIKKEATTIDQSLSIKESKFFKRLSTTIQESILKNYPIDFLKKAMIEIDGYLGGPGFRHINNLDSFIPSNLHDKWERSLIKAEAIKPKSAPAGLVETL